MEYRSQEVKVGLLVLVAMVLFFVFVFSITKAGLKRDFNTYTVRFIQTNGVQPGTQVRIGGVLVGSVEKVYFPPDDNTRIELLLKVDANAPVRQNSLAFITTIGIMGEYYIEITTGSQDMPLLPSGSRIPSKDIATLSQLGEPLQKVSAQLETLLANINAILTPQTQENITGIITNVNDILAENEKKAGDLLENFSTLTLELQDLGRRLDTMMTQNANSFSEVLSRLNSSMARAESLMHDLSTTTEYINAIVLTNEATFHEAMENLEDASRNFEEFSRQIKYKPWSLLRKSNPPERKVSN